MSNKLLVSGPFNALRMEGSINDNIKTLYVFFDIHMPIEKQTKCDTDNYYDILDYFNDNLGKTDSEIDLFLEIDIATIVKSRNKKNAKSLSKKEDKTYIQKLLDFFTENFDFNKDNNKVKQSKRFPHVKFHYIDFRHTKPYTTFYLATEKLYEHINLEAYRFLPEINIKFLEVYHLVKEDYKFIYELVETYKPIHIQNKISDNQEDYEIVFKNYIYKIFYKYKDHKLQTNIVNYINTNIKFLFEDFFDYSEAVSKFIDSQYFEIYGVTLSEYYMNKTNYYTTPKTSGIKSENLYTELINAYHQFNAKIELIYSNLIDMYFLRRFLDSSYIKKSIIYTGGYHSTNYVIFLIKYYNFKITNYSFLKYDLETIYDIIKNEDRVSLQILYLFYDESLISNNDYVQCSDLTTFPKHFN